MSSGSWATLRVAYAEAVDRRARGEQSSDVLVDTLERHGVAPVWTRPGSARDLLEVAFSADVPQQRLRGHMLRAVPRVVRRRTDLDRLAPPAPEAVMDRERRLRAATCWWAIPDQWIPLSHVTAHERRGWRPGRSSTALLPLPVVLDPGCGDSLADCLQLPPDVEGWHNVLAWLRVDDPEEVVAIADEAEDEHYLLDVVVGSTKVAETLVPLDLARVLAGLAAADVVSDGLLQVNLAPGTREPYLGRLRCHLPE